MSDLSPQNFPATAAQWWRSVAARFPTVLCLAVLAGVLSQLPALLAPAFFQVYVDEVLITRHHDWLTSLVAAMGASLVFGWVALRLFQRLRGRLSDQLADSVGDRLVSTLMWRETSGDGGMRDAHLAAKGLALTDGLAGRLLQISVDMVALAFFVGLMSLYSLGLVALVLSMMLLGLGWGALRFSKRDNRDIFEGESGLFETLFGFAASGTSLQTQGAAREGMREWAAEHQSWSDAVQREQSRSHLTWSGFVLLGGLSHAATLAAGGWLVASGTLSLGALVAFQALLALALSRFHSFVRTTITLHADSAALAEQLGDIDLSAQPDRKGAPRVSQEFDATIRLDEVVVQPQGDAARDAPLNVEIGPGEQMAIMGSLGSDASRLARVIAGDAQPSRGRVWFGGVDMVEVAESARVSFLTVADEELYWFEGSVADNLSLWDPSVGYEEISAAARAACVHQMILRRLGGYDEPLLAAAANFSARERSQLALARALVRKPEVVIVDRAFDHIEPAICEAIAANLRDMGTTLIVAGSQPCWADWADHVVQTEDITRDCEEAWEASAGADLSESPPEPLVRREDTLGEVAGLIEAAAARGESVDASAPAFRDGLRREFGWATTFSLFAGFLGIALAVATGSIVRDVLPHGDIFALGVWTSALGLAALSAAVVSVVTARSGTRIETILTASIQSMLVDRFARARQFEADAQMPGGWTTRLEQSREAVRKLVPVAVEAVAFLSTALLLVGLLYWYAPRLATLSVALPLTVGLAGAVWGLRRIAGWRSRLGQWQCSVHGRLASRMQARAFLRRAGALDRAFEHWRAEAARSRQTVGDGAKLDGGLERALALGPGLAMLVLIVTSYVAVSRWQSLEVSVFVAFASAYMILVSVLLDLARAARDSVAPAAALLDIGPLWHREERGAAVGEIDGRLEINRLTVRPPAADRPLLRGLTLEAQHGDLVAVVGGSARGRSALLMALLGLQELESGAIYVDGRDLSRLDQDQWRDKVGSLPDRVGLPSGQVGWLLSGHGRSEESARELAELVGLAGWVARLPRGYRTRLGRDGVQPSPEVRRRIRLAQLLGAKLPLMVLDDPTRGLEPDVARAVLERLQSSEATSVVATSDPAVARYADVVVDLSR